VIQNSLHRFTAKYNCRLIKETRQLYSITNGRVTFGRRRVRPGKTGVRSLLQPLRSFTPF